MTDLHRYQIGGEEMAYPYIPSGGLVQTAFNQFRKSFPAKVDSGTLKKLGLASSNEGSLLNILKFLGVTDDENNRTPVGTKLFTQHEDTKYQAELSSLIKKGYSDLFDLHGDTAWKLDRDALISFFRGADETSAVTGARQALTFQTLASLSGRRDEAIPSRGSTGPRQPRLQKEKAAKNNGSSGAAKGSTEQIVTPNSNFGLTVRVEINLPANGSQATYDNIFKSIRKNLLNDSD